MKDQRVKRQRKNKKNKKNPKNNIIRDKKNNIQ